jgi:hypothetical protein
MFPATMSKYTRANTIYKLTSVQNGFNHWHVKRYCVSTGWGGKVLLELVGEIVYLKERRLLERTGPYTGRTLALMLHTMYIHERNCMDRNGLI